METKERALKIVETLEENYPEAHCSLQYRSAFELLVATRLSAQCTDERVNIVTQELFKNYNTPEAMAEADLNEIEGIIHSCGLYKTKARDLKGMSRRLLADYGGNIPDTIDELTRLPGVGRKTANLIVGDVYGRPAIVADTHCIRLSNRLGLVQSNDPFKVETGLKGLIPPEKSSMFCHRLVWHGRAVCRARRPDCAVCCLREFCASAASFG